MAKTDMDRELKKGSTELLILSLLEGRARLGIVKDGRLGDRLLYALVRP